jgi:hypothetical protein
LLDGRDKVSLGCPSLRGATNARNAADATDVTHSGESMA